MAQELEYHTAHAEMYGYATVKKNSGFVYFVFYNPVQHAHIDTHIHFAKLMFARQLITVLAHLPELDPKDRISDMSCALAAALDSDIHFQTAVVEYADTEESKTLAKFCRKIAVPWRQALRAEQRLSSKKYKQAIVGMCLHAFFVDGTQVFIGVSHANNRSKHENGIFRLKFPVDAPSRSTLKLEEAILTFLSAEQQATLLSEPATAVDLGACPGGWTYQLVQRGLHVEAVDNGAMDATLMATGRVDYFAADGFKYRPQYKRVNWLVCDMIEQPDKVLRLMCQWLTQGWTQHAIFNLKLPMKQRFSAMQSLLDELTESLGATSERYQIQYQHLYHNRDEVTVCVIQETNR